MQFYLMSHKIMLCDCGETYIGEFFEKTYRNDPKKLYSEEVSFMSRKLVKTEMSHRKDYDSFKLLDSNNSV